MAADAEHDITATTVTVSQHNIGHWNPRSNHATPYTRLRMMRACGADDVEVFTPADVQKTTFSDDR
jgi:hypothetical protein